MKKYYLIEGLLASDGYVDELSRKELPPNGVWLTREDVMELLYDLQADSWKKCKQRLDTVFEKEEG